MDPQNLLPGIHINIFSAPYIITFVTKEMSARVTQGPNKSLHFYTGHFHAQLLFSLLYKM
jgi:hypothetical protein